MKPSPVREPRWPAFVAMVADSCIYLALPDRLSVGPPLAVTGDHLSSADTACIHLSARPLQHHTGTDVRR